MQRERGDDFRAPPGQMPELYPAKAGSLSQLEGDRVLKALRDSIDNKTLIDGHSPVIVLAKGGKAGQVSDFLRDNARRLGGDYRPYTGSIDTLEETMMGIISKVEEGGGGVPLLIGQTKKPFDREAHDTSREIFMYGLPSYARVAIAGNDELFNNLCSRYNRSIPVRLD
jgi:hypothetical protein